MILGCSQAGRHGSLTPTFTGSNPVTPANKEERDFMNFRELEEFARYRERTHRLEYKFFPHTEWCAYYADDLWPIPSIFTYGRPHTTQELMIKCLSIDGYNPSKVWGRFKAYLEIYERIKKYAGIDNPRYTFKVGDV